MGNEGSAPGHNINKSIYSTQKEAPPNPAKNATDESKQILEQMRINRGNKYSGQNSAILELEEICQLKQRVFKSITFEEKGNDSLTVVSSDPYILLDLARYFVEITNGNVYKNSTVGSKRFGANFQITLLLKGACSKQHGFGPNWTPIFIDYMNEAHPNYRLVTAAMISGMKGPLEKLYFIPINTINQSKQNMDQDVQLQHNEGNKDVGTFQ